MQNKPKYSFFKNWKYACDGLITAIKTDSSFRLELFCAIFIVALILYVDTTLTNKAFSSAVMQIREQILKDISKIENP